MAKTEKFDPADYLATSEDVAAFLSEAFEDGDDSTIAAALGAAVRSVGFSSIAEKTGLSRQGLYKALSDNGRPELATVMKVLTALDLQLVAKPKSNAA